MRRCVVNVATGHYTVGQDRLTTELLKYSPNTDMMRWANVLPPGSPSHADVPYGFKAWALFEALVADCDLVLWADACMIPIRSMTPLWERVERDGYWISNNGYWNAEWTASSAYPLLGISEEENWTVKHVVATCFALNLQSEIGKSALDQYIRFAQNGAFCGPWTGGIGTQHRHDQTALSVIAHRLGMQLTNAPEIFAYKGGETEATLVVADGDY